MILFLAALPDPETAAQIGAAFSDEIPGVVLTPPEKLHVTLRYLGNTQIEPKVLVERLDAEFKALGKERIMIKLGPNPVWFNRTVLAIPAHGAEELKDCCDAACTSLEVGPRMENFSGHMTLAHRRRVCPQATIRMLKRVELRQTFAVEAVHLVQSQVSGNKTNYIHLEEVRLPRISSQS